MNQYDILQQKLARGWNTWNTRSFLSHVLLPEGFALNLAVKDYWKPAYLKEALMGIKGPTEAKCRPGWRSYDGSYTDLRLYWRDLVLRVQSATVDDELVLLVTPEHDLTRHVVLVLETGILWNRAGYVEHGDHGAIVGRFNERSVRVFTANTTVDEVYIQTQTPYFAVALTGPVGFSTGVARSSAEITQLIADAELRSRVSLATLGTLAEVAAPIQTCIAWNTVYDPTKERVITPVSRDWSTWDFGGYVLFGWDTFFAALLASVNNRDLAYANAIAMAGERAAEGFIPNWAGGTGCKMLDRSMPQVGGLVVREIYRRYRESWFLEAVFPDLLASNRWYAARRSCDGFICLGSNYFTPVVGTWEETNGVGELLGAKFEFGLDNSPMYDDVPFNAANGLMLQADVGQMSLHIADSEALAEIAVILGRLEEAAELRSRAMAFRLRLRELWDNVTGIFRNKELSTGRLSARISPTSFYPLLCDGATPEQAARMVSEHLLNPDEFWGEWVLPTISRDDPAFPDQNYWRGKIWAPVNFLTYLALRRGGQRDAARQLAEKSQALLLHEWREHGHVHENYSADTGLGCDRPDSDSFYQWGGLLGLMAHIEAGVMAAPEDDLCE